MPALMLDGVGVAARRRAVLAERVAEMARRGQRPCLAAITLREDAGWKVYQRNQREACAKVGLLHRSVEIGARATLATRSAVATMDDLAAAIEALNIDADVHGIIVQSPLPEGFDQPAIQALISPDKDVEGVGPANLGLVLAGRPSLAPCTALAALAMASEAISDLTGCEAVVVGASTIVGKPVAMLLQSAGATVTLCHVHTADLAAHTRRADLVVVAVGRPGLLTRSMVKPGATVIDVGINRIIDSDGTPRIVGDVAAEVADIAGKMTPVPGGVGAVTTTILLEATVLAAERLAQARPAIDAHDVQRLLGPGVQLDPRTAERLAMVLARHLPSLPNSGAGGSALERRLASGVLVMDGAMGSALIARGVAIDRVAWAASEHPDVVLGVHREFVNAGAGALVAASFQANRFVCGSREAAVRLCGESVRLARQAAGGAALVLGSIGPLGRVVGVDVSESDSEGAFAEMAMAMADAGADGVLIETMPSTVEALCALRAVRHHTRLSVIVSRAMARDDASEIAEFVRAVEDAGACAVGVNCAAGPRALLPVVRRLSRLSRLPVVVRPNAGMPTRDGLRLAYHLRSDYLVEQARAYVAVGAAAVGGCCGVSAEHIAAVAAALQGQPLAPRNREMAEAVAEPQPAARHPLLTGGMLPWAWLPGRMPPAQAATAAKALAESGARAIGLRAAWPGSPSGARLVAALRHIADAAGIEPVLDVMVHEAPLSAVQDVLRQAHLLGIRLITLDATGADWALHAEGTARCVDLVARLNRGRDLSGSRIEQPTDFTAIVRIPAERACEAANLSAAGAHAIMLPPIYAPSVFIAAMQAIPDHVPVIAEVLVLPDAATAEELDNEWPAMSVPQRLKDRLRHDPEADVHGVIRFAQAWRSRLRAIAVQAVEHGTEQAQRVVRGMGRGGIA